MGKLGLVPSSLRTASSTIRLYRTKMNVKVQVYFCSHQQYLVWRAASA